MNEQNFDKILRRKMAEERDFPFFDEKWDKMERKLDDFHNRKRYERLVWASALSFVSLLGVLLFVVSQLWDTKNSLTNLTQKVQQLSESKSPVVMDSLLKGSVIRQDTVYHHIIVKRYDTIFQTVVQRSLSETEFKNMDFDKVNISSKIQTPVIDLSLSSSEKTVLSIRHANNDETTSKLVNDSLNTEMGDINSKVDKQSADKLISATDSQIQKSEINISELKSDTLTADKQAPKSESDTPKSEIIPPLSKGHIGLLRRVLTDSIADEKTSNQHKPILKPLKLNGYEIGISGGSAFIGERDIRQQMGYSAGLKGGVGLGQRFKVVTEAQFVGLYYRLNSFPNRSDIPTVNPPTVNDELSSIHVRQSDGRVFLGVQYDVTRSRLRPFVGVGAVMAFDIEEKYRFKFINRLTNEGVVIVAHNRSKDFDEVFWRVSAGLSYPIFKKLKVQIEGSFDAPFDHKYYNQPLFQLKGAALYRF